MHDVTQGLGESPLTVETTHPDPQLSSQRPPAHSAGLQIRYPRNNIRNNTRDLEERFELARRANESALDEQLWMTSWRKNIAYQW